MGDFAKMAVAPITSTVGSATGQFLGDISGSNAAGEAYGQVAQAQLDEQRRTQELAVGAAKEAQLYAAPTENELLALQSQLDLMNRQIQIASAAYDRDKTIIEAVDPALIEAGRQAFQLLQGKESAALSPIRNQRERDRQKLSDSLRNQMGAGFEQTTAGQQALQRFDADTEGLMQQAQQATFGQLIGVAQNARSQATSSTLGNMQLAGQLGASYSAGQNTIRTRQATAAGNVANAYTQNSLTPYAGAAYAGDLYAAQSQQQLFSELVQGGAKVAASGAAG